MSEVEYYAKGNIRVTNSRAMLGDKTYAMANITSVSMGEIPANRNAGMFLAAVGVVGLLLGSQIGESGCIGIALLCLVIGIVLAALAKTYYAVRIGSASGESDAFRSSVRQDIQEVVSAMNEAIIKRG